MNGNRAPWVGIFALLSALISVGFERERDWKWPINSQDGQNPTLEFCKDLKYCS